MDQVLREVIKNCNLCSKYQIDYRKGRVENLAFAYSYIPEKVKLLWIVESPPNSYPPRYFYRPDLTQFDSLYREVMKALGIYTSNPKGDSLQRFCGLGHFLIDSIKCPADKFNSHLKPFMMNNCSTILKEEVKQLNPEKIIIVKADVYFPVYSSLAEMGYANRVLNDSPIPFPGSGQQKRFRELVESCLHRKQVIF